VDAISAGYYHSCALTNKGEVKCWGANGSGQLGDGTTEDRSSPVTVQGLELGAVAVSTGGAHTCAIEKPGNLKCWGNNYYGQIGDGTKINRTTPQSVPNLELGVTAVSAGYGHTCAITPANTAKCWGYNVHRQSENFPFAEPLSPVEVIGFP